jgi:hypothetical protein
VHFPQAGLEPRSSYLCLLSSQDSKWEPLYLDLFLRSIG